MHDRMVEIAWECEVRVGLLLGLYRQAVMFSFQLDSCKKWGIYLAFQYETSSTYFSKANCKLQVINGKEIEWKLPKHPWNTYGAFTVR